ncbi:hypothetical protein BT93_E1420 [Corymbia citriodora subsp. variegata]|nr:hypothetical protein BT93_E1420 [Corymbia citriodora subsp. variegata]
MEASLKFHSLLSFALILALSTPRESASEYSFTTELVRIDTPNSSDPYQHVVNAFRRSISRAHRLSQNSAGTLAMPPGVLTNSDGSFTMNMSIGNPPAPFVGIADTGSDLIWTQCEPCLQCFDQASPVFDPSMSSTYEVIMCETPLCNALLPYSFCGPDLDLFCMNSNSYGDGSYTYGNIATENFILGYVSGQPVNAILLFECGHMNGGTFTKVTDGIIGLGGGPVSLVSQLSDDTGGRFSYCLVPLGSTTKTSKLNFGANAEVGGDGAVSTPLIQRDDQKTFYYLYLEAVSVDNRRIDFPPGGPSPDQGNIIIDSGTSLTLLPQDFYSQIEAAVIESVQLPRVNDPSQTLSLCFQVATEVNLPFLTFHFNGADVRLPALNAFVLIAQNVLCLTLGPSPTALYGNVAQTNFLVGHDIPNKIVSFKPVDCTLF